MENLGYGRRESLREMKAVNAGAAMTTSGVPMGLSLPQDGSQMD